MRPSDSDALQPLLEKSGLAKVRKPQDAVGLTLPVAAVYAEVRFLMSEKLVSESSTLRTVSFRIKREDQSMWGHPKR